MTERIYLTDKRYALLTSRVQENFWRDKLKLELNGPVMTQFENEQRQNFLEELDQAKTIEEAETLDSIYMGVHHYSGNVHLGYNPEAADNS